MCTTPLKTLKGQIPQIQKQFESGSFCCDSSHCVDAPFFPSPPIITDLCLSSGTCQLPPPPNAADQTPAASTLVPASACHTSLIWNQENNYAGEQKAPLSSL